MALNNDAKMIFIENYMEAADEKNRELIKEKMTLWVNSCDARNEAVRNSARLYFSEDYSDSVIAEREKNVTEMKMAEFECRSDLGRQIAFYATMQEYRQMDLNRPEQIIDWAINEGTSPIPTQRARWDWVLKVPGVICCNPGPNKEIQLEPIPLDYEPDLSWLPSSSVLHTDPSSSVLDGDNASKKKKDSRKQNKKENSRKKNSRG